MRGRGIGALVAVVAVGAGAVGYNQWRDSRYDACVARGERLAGLGVMGEQPGGLSGLPPSPGCDEERADAYAVRYVSGPIERAAAIAFVSGSAGRDGWRLRVSPDGLCGDKEIDDRSVHLRMSFPDADRYEILASEFSDIGGTCP